MSSILIKSVKALIALVLVICMCITISGCDNNTKDIEGADQICVSGSYVESWMYVFTDQSFIEEMVNIYNGIKYEETDESVDMMTANGVYSFTFSKGNETLARFVVDSNNIMTFEAGTQCYKIVSDFDFAHIQSLVNEQIEMVSGTLSTPDEA